LLGISLKSAPHFRETTKFDMSAIQKNPDHKKRKELSELEVWVVFVFCIDVILY